MNEESPATLELANLALKQAERKKKKSPKIYHIIALFKIFKMYFLLMTSIHSKAEIDLQSLVIY